MLTGRGGAGLAPIQLVSLPYKNPPESARLCAKMMLMGSCIEVGCLVMMLK
jgi:hypothetical protein